MIESIGQWIVAVIGWAQQIPDQGWAILLGILFGGIVTQWLKRTLPVKVMFPNWPEHWYVMSLRIVALVAAFIPAYIIWPDDQYEIWAALAIGFATPSIYRILTFFVYKKWPGLEARWSGTE
jgi:hypothetical protein